MSLNDIKLKIDKLSEMQMQEIFKIILKNGEKYTHNTNGIFVNLSQFNPTTIAQITTYLNYCANNDTYLCEMDKLRQYTSLEAT